MTMTQEIQTQLKPEPQKDENLDDALDALKRMIVARVSNGELKGFTEAERLCGVAQELRRAVATRIGDLDENEYNNEGLEGDFGVIGAGRRRVRRARNVYQGAMNIIGGDDHMEMQREAMLAANRVIDTKEATANAATARDEARELASLAALPAEDRAAVEDRIALLKKRINERKKNDDNVVPTDDVRGHQAGENGRRAHEAGAYGAVLR